MKTAFADTFYWIAITAPSDAAYERARRVTDDIVTTDEVLAEYLTFFCTGPEYMRRKAAANARDYLALPIVAAVGGSWMVDRKLIAEKNWPAIRALTAEAVQLAAPVS